MAAEARRQMRMAATKRSFRHASHLLPQKATPSDFSVGFPKKLAIALPAHTFRFETVICPICRSTCLSLLAEWSELACEGPRVWQETAEMLLESGMVNITTYRHCERQNSHDRARHPEHGLHPLLAPAELRFVVDIPERLEGQFALADVIEASACGLAQAKKGMPLIECEDLCIGVTEPLRYKQGQAHGLACASLTNQEAYAQRRSRAGSGDTAHRLAWPRTTMAAISAA